MSHTDDGTLHAWLDGELAVDAEARLREHLATCAECRGRLDVARATRTRAHEILRYADPVRIEQPDFAAMLARRGGGARAADVGTPGVGARVRPLLLPWAASLVLAVGAGWFAQELLRDGGAGGAPDRVAAFQAAEARMEESSAAVQSEAGGAPAADAALPPTPPPVAATGQTTMAAPAAAGDRGTPAGRVARMAQGSVAEGGDERTAGAAATEGAAAAAAPAREEQLALEEVVIPQPAPVRRPQEAQPLVGYSPSARPAAAKAAADLHAEALPPPAPDLDLSTAAPGWPAAWRAVDAAGAAGALGTAPKVIAELPVTGYEAAADGSAVVRVSQTLPGGERLLLLQRPAPDAGEMERPDADVPAAAAPLPRPPTPETATVTGFEAPVGAAFRQGGLELLLRAPVSADSLGRLQARVR